MPLSAVAGVVPATEPNQIDRQNRQRQIVVGAGFAGRDMGEVIARARAVADSMPLPAGVTIKLAGDLRYMDDAFSSLNLAIALAVLFVYMILASQFGSFIHPFTIMLALPFSVIGALLALLAARFSLDMLAMIGMMLLMGLVTKNSILLVEFINQMKRRGLSTHEAILQAGPIRLRPILMTTMAMIFGMAPVAAGFGAGAELRQPMGVSIIGGLITSTLLTLVAVPVAYSLIDDLGRWITRRFRRTAAGPESEPAPREPAAQTN
jgi:HAE1 family hydrophobic/amphiphilic exporter-1